MRAIKTRDLKRAVEVLAQVSDKFSRIDYYRGLATEIGQSDPRFKEIHDLSKKVSAAMVTLRGNDKATRGKDNACRNLGTPCFFRKNGGNGFVCGYSGGAAAMNCKGRKPNPPPDPYGGKVLEDGKIEYKTRAGYVAVVDPNGELANFRRGDIVHYQPRRSLDIVLGTGSFLLEERGLWAKGRDDGEVVFYSAGNIRNFMADSIRMPRNPQEIRLDGANLYKHPVDAMLPTNILSGDIVIGGQLWPGELQIVTERNPSC